MPAPQQRMTPIYGSWWKVPRQPLTIRQSSLHSPAKSPAAALAELLGVTIEVLKDGSAGLQRSARDRMVAAAWRADARAKELIRQDRLLNPRLWPDQDPIQAEKASRYLEEV